MGERGARRGNRHGCWPYFLRVAAARGTKSRGRLEIRRRHGRQGGASAPRKKEQGRQLAARHGGEHDSLLLLLWDACCAMEKKTGRLLWRLKKNEGWECKIAQVQGERAAIYRETLGLGLLSGLGWAGPKHVIGLR
jgi:hypothetical protein